MWVTINVGKDFCCSFLNNHVSTEVVNNVNVLNIFQKSSADFDEIQNETQWEFLRQIIDFDYNSLIFCCVSQGFFKVGNCLFHLIFKEELGLECVESLGLEKRKLFAVLDCINRRGKFFMLNFDITVPVPVVGSFLDRVS